MGTRNSPWWVDDSMPAPCASTRTLEAAITPRAKRVEWSICRDERTWRKSGQGYERTWERQTRSELSEAIYRGDPSFLADRNPLSIGVASIVEDRISLSTGWAIQDNGRARPDVYHMLTVRGKSGYACQAIPKMVLFASHYAFYWHP